MFMCRLFSLKLIWSSKYEKMTFHYKSQAEVYRSKVTQDYKTVYQVQTLYLENHG